MKLRLLVASALLAACAGAEHAPPPATTPVSAPIASAAPAPAPELAFYEPNRVHAAKLLAENCVRCHGDGAVPDLRVAPKTSDAAAWGKIVEVVATAKMPPATPEKPFPLDPAIREALLHDAFALSTAAYPPGAVPTLYDSTMWATLVHEIGDPAVGHDEIEALMRKHAGGIGGLRDDPRRQPVRLPFILPLTQVNMNLIGYEVCRRMLGTESKQHDVSLGKDTSESATRRIATELHHLVYRVAPTDAELEAETGTMRRIEAQASVEQAAVALCTAEISGPKLLIASELHDSVRASP